MSDETALTPCANVPLIEVPKMSGIEIAASDVKKICGRPHFHYVGYASPAASAVTESIHDVQAYEFTDTLIMVLKKNERQISFLHIYHHATTFFPCWCAHRAHPILLTIAADHGLPAAFAITWLAGLPSVFYVFV